MSTKKDDHDAAAVATAKHTDPAHPLHSLECCPPGEGDLDGTIKHCNTASAALRKGDLSTAFAHLCLMVEAQRLALTNGAAVHEAAGGEVSGTLLEALANQLDGCARACETAKKAADPVAGRSTRSVPWDVVVPVTNNVFARLFGVKSAAPHPSQPKTP